MNLRAIGAKAAATAFTSAGNVIIAGVLNIGPVNTFDGATGCTTTTWQQSLPVQAFGYFDKSGRPGVDVADSSTRLYIIQAASIPLTADQISENSVFVAEGQTWTVLRASADPSGAIITLTCVAIPEVTTPS